jgi:hypothetical protein
MSTQRQRKANRHNAKLSTGPVTEQGKQAVRRNAYKHGLYAQFANLGEWEDPEALAALNQGYIDDYQPVGAVEQDLTAQAVRTIWQIRHLCNIERHFCETQLASKWKICLATGGVPDDSSLGNLWHAQSIPCRGWAGRTSFFDIVSRRKARAQRDYDHAIEALERQQESRLAESALAYQVARAETSLGIVPASQTNQKLNREIGFDPQKSPFDPPPQAALPSGSPESAQTPEIVTASPVNPGTIEPQSGHPATPSNQKRNCEIGFDPQFPQNAPPDPPKVVADHPNIREIVQTPVVFSTCTEESGIARLPRHPETLSNQKPNPEIGFDPQKSPIEPRAPAGQPVEGPLM